MMLLNYPSILKIEAYGTCFVYTCLVAIFEQIAEPARWDVGLYPSPIGRGP